MTQQQASALLPTDAVWSCSFGYPGEERYSEYWRGFLGCCYVIEKNGQDWSFRVVQS
jgi:hypothetical protein